MALRSTRGNLMNDVDALGPNPRKTPLRFLYSWPLTLAMLSLCSAPTLGSDHLDSITDFYFTGFNASSNSLVYLRDSFVDNDQVYLTSEQIPKSSTENFIVPISHGIGRVLYAKPFKGRNVLTGKPTSFSTTFIFSITNPEQLEMGDGLAFLISTNNTSVGSGGEYLGVLDQSSNELSLARTFAVEFDTWQNPELLDIDGNHVGVDVNSMISKRAFTAGFWTDDNVFHLLPLTGLRLQAWIDYSSDDREIDVSISPILGRKPRRPLLSFDMDLTEVMQEEMFVGFSAATGELSAEHVVYAWSFNTTGPARDFEFIVLRAGSQLLLIRWLCVGAASVMVILICFTLWSLYKTYRRQSSSKVHIGDPEAAVMPADPIGDAARIQANLNISKVLAENHMRAFTEGR